jgi:glucokinase
VAEISSSSAVIGVDLGGTNLRVAGITAKGEVLTLHREETKADSGPEAVVDRLLFSLRKIEDSLVADGREVCAAALGVPGIVSTKKGSVVSSPNLPGWNNLSLLEIVRREFSHPILLENDANAAAFGEFWIGAGRGRKNIVLITLGTGVGGGIIQDGALLRGTEGMAGEIGHLTVIADGHSCACGNRGCLEQYASATGISRRYRQLSLKDSGVPLPEEDLREITAETVYRKALDGDAAALRAFSEAGTFLGIVLASMVNILNPEMIIIGGGVLPAWDFFQPAAALEMRRRAFQTPAEMVELVPAALGDRAGCIGAAGLAWKSLQANEI